MNEFPAATQINSVLGSHSIRRLVSPLLSSYCRLSSITSIMRGMPVELVERIIHFALRVPEQADSAWIFRAKAPWATVASLVNASRLLRALTLREWFATLCIQSSTDWEYLERNPWVWACARELRCVGDALAWCHDLATVAHIQSKAISRSTALRYLWCDFAPRRMAEISLPTRWTSFVAGFAGCSNLTRIEFVHIAPTSVDDLRLLSALTPMLEVHRLGTCQEHCKVPNCSLCQAGSSVRILNEAVPPARITRELKRGHFGLPKLRALSLNIHLLVAEYPCEAHVSPAVTCKTPSRPRCSRCAKQAEIATHDAQASVNKVLSETFGSLSQNSVTWCSAEPRPIGMGWRACDLRDQRVQAQDVV